MTAYVNSAKNIQFISFHFRNGSFFFFFKHYTHKKTTQRTIGCEKSLNFFFFFTSQSKNTTIFVRIFCGGVFTKNIGTSPMFSDPRASPFRGCRGWNRGNLAPRKCSLSEAVARPNRSQNAALQERASARKIFVYEPALVMALMDRKQRRAYWK